MGLGSLKMKLKKGLGFLNKGQKKVDNFLAKQELKKLRGTALVDRTSKEEVKKLLANAKLERQLKSEQRKLLMEEIKIKRLNEKRLPGNNFANANKFLFGNMGKEPVSKEEKMEDKKIRSFL